MSLRMLHLLASLSLWRLAEAAGSGPGCYAVSSGCLPYGDCCHPVPNRRSAVAPGLSCVRVDRVGIDPTMTSSHGPASVLMVDACPSGATGADARRCRRTSPPRSLADARLLPVMSADGLLFRSAHCTGCHGRTDLVLPEVSVGCTRRWPTVGGARPSPRVLRDLLTSGRDLPDGCLVATRFPGRPVHLCVSGVIDSCLSGSATEAERRLCEDGGVAMVTDSSCGVLRNQACRDCHGECAEELHAFRESSEDNPDDEDPSVLSNVLNFWIPLEDAVDGDRMANSDGGNFSGAGLAPNTTSPPASDDDEGTVETFEPHQVVLIVTYSVSILSLILLLTVYALLPHLRNRAGQLLMSHSASVMALQAAQLLSMCTDSLVGPGCVALHFLFHFFLVSAFVWAFLFGWDLLRTFTSLLRNSAFKPSRYGRFALIGWGLPLILTGILVALHLSIGLLDADNGCRYRPDRVAFMVGLSFSPLVVAIVFNAAIVCLLSAQLVRTYRETRTVGRSSASKLCIMTVKVSVIMGVAWLPYFLIVLIDRGHNSDTAGFAGEFLCSLHGLFLAIGFTGNRRVRARLSEMTSSVLKTSSSSDGLSASRLQARRSQDIRCHAPLVRACGERSCSLAAV